MSAIPIVEAPDTPIQRPFPPRDATDSLSHILAWVDANQKFLAEQRKRYGADKIEYSKRYIANRRKTDVGFRLLMNLRCRISAALKGQGKSRRTMQLVGCSITELRAHLEARFKPGMSWSNYGQWHVDHIIPCQYFDLTRPAEQRRCFHYTNLQPLWADENFKKSGRRPGNA